MAIGKKLLLCVVHKKNIMCTAPPNNQVTRSVSVQIVMVFFQPNEMGPDASSKPISSIKALFTKIQRDRKVHPAGQVLKQPFRVEF